MLNRSLLFIFLLFSQCSFVATKKEDNPSKPIVLVSIAPYLSLVGAIGGDLIEVETIIPSNLNPHLFEPTPRHIARIAKGRVWFRIGEPFEEKIFSLLALPSQKIFISDLRTNIPLYPIEESLLCTNLCHHSDSLDRHIWMSPKLMQVQAKMIATTLSECFPEYAEQFQKNLEMSLSQLDGLDIEIHQMLTPFSGMSFITSHAAFGYFCREYGLKQLSIEQEGKEARPRYLESLLNEAEHARAPIAFALPQHNNKGACLVAERLNIPLEITNPYSSDYFTMMRKLALSISKAASVKAGLEEPL